MDTLKPREAAALQTLQLLRAHDLVRGPIIGGCAYALLTGDWSGIADIDIDCVIADGSWPENCPLQPDDWDMNGAIAGATDPGNGLAVQFTGYADFAAVMGHGYATTWASGFAVMSAADVVDRFAARGRDGSDGERDLARSVRLITQYGLTQGCHDWKDTSCVADYFRAANAEGYTPQSLRNP
jgi:hypothetical protein